jgi:hypothetical protein
MARNRNNYAVQGMFIGPAPGSGFHFIDYSGVLNNDTTGNIYKNHNLLMKIDRLTAFDYDFIVERRDIKSLGTRSLLARPIINSPYAILNFEYMLNGLKNDARLGLDVNFNQFQYPYSGQPFHSGKVCPISGLHERRLLLQVTGDPWWPYVYKDSRNIFIAVSPEGTDLRGAEMNEDFVTPDTLQNIDRNSPGYQVISFGNCYLTSYSTEAAINDIPKSRVSYICDNAAFFTSGSGCQTPAVNTRTREALAGKKFTIPNGFDEGGPSVLQPGDIRLDIKETGTNLDPRDLGLNMTDAKIDKYSISFNLNRDPLRSVGYELPLDRRMTFPVMAEVSFTMTVGDANSGSLIDLANYDRGHNITIKLHNPQCNAPYSLNQIDPRNPGPTAISGAIAIQYEVLDAKFKNITYSDSIGANKRATLDFEAEIDPDNFNHGLFISGLLNIEKLEDFILLEHTAGVNSGDFGYVLAEDGTLLVNNLVPLF